MKIYLATDHAGFELKEKVKENLLKMGYEVEDCGALSFDKNDDYPDFIAKAAIKISSNPTDIAIILGGSGQGEAIVANKFKHVRCALFYSLATAKEAIDIKGNKSDDPFEILKLARYHNHANMLSLGIRFLKEDEIFKAIEIFITSPLSNEERHKRRIDKISKLEEVNKA